jgi:hypothetical protein
MARQRIDRGAIEGTCEQCFTVGPLQVFDSFEQTWRLGLVRVRTDWYRSWVCQTCGYALRQSLAPDAESRST